MIALPKGVQLDSEENASSTLKYRHLCHQKKSEFVILVGMGGHFSLPTEAFAISDTPGQMTHVLAFM